jgi:hypothetical protein
MATKRPAKAAPGRLIGYAASPPRNRAPIPTVTNSRPPAASPSRGTRLRRRSHPSRPRRSAAGHQTGRHPGVVRLDRLARSVSHLLAVIEQLERALIAERNRAGLKAARSRGRMGQSGAQGARPGGDPQGPGSARRRLARCGSGAARQLAADGTANASRPALGGCCAGAEPRPSIGPVDR